MELGILEFKAEDFKFVDMSEPKPTCRFGPTEYQAERIAKEVNEILLRKLEKAPVVYWPDDKSMTPRFRDMGTAQGVGDTHTARLVCIEEVKG